MWDFWRTGSKAALGTSESSNSVSEVAAIRPKRSQRDLKKFISRVISFKDLRISVEHPSVATEEDAGARAQLPGVPASLHRGGSHRVAVEKNKLVIIMVGLPARGKTFLCNKLLCYLNWLGHTTAHFNVGQYRRKQKGESELQDAAFFDHNNPAGRAARERAFQAALADMMSYVQSDHGQVAVFDATNSTNERRQKIVDALYGRVKFIFIETICTDPNVLHQNYLNKMRYSPDYQGCNMEQAVEDFVSRIRKYEEVYEPITDRNIHYIKLTDITTGRGHIDINRISGYIPGKIVFYLMQVCKSGMTNARKIWLTRHGESLYNQKALIGGDSDLSPNGAAYAGVLPAVVASRLPQGRDGSPVPVSVWTSTLRRTIKTAEQLPYAKLKWKALDEIDAGICDGMTYAEIAAKYPGEYTARKKDKLRYRYPRGESYLDMIQRLEPVITELERGGESIVVVSHQAVLRVIFGYLTAKSQEEIPSISIPLHTVIELTPMPDGTVSVEYISVPVNSLGLEASIEEAPVGLVVPPPYMAGPTTAAAAAAYATSAAVADMTAVIPCDISGGKAISVTAGVGAGGEERAPFLLPPAPHYISTTGMC